MADFPKIENPKTARFKNSFEKAVLIPDVNISKLSRDERTKLKTTHSQIGLVTREKGNLILYSKLPQNSPLKRMNPIANLIFSATDKSIFGIHLRLSFLTLYQDVGNGVVSIR